VDDWEAKMKGDAEGMVWGVGEEVGRGEKLQAGGAEVVFEEIGPDVVELVEIDVLAGPGFEVAGNAHDFALELVDAAGGLAEVEIGMAIGVVVAGVVEGFGGGEDGGGVGLNWRIVHPPLLPGQVRTRRQGELSERTESEVNQSRAVVWTRGFAAAN
jgi:hypothetical protein